MQIWGIAFLSYWGYCVLCFIVPCGIWVARLWRQQNKEKLHPAAMIQRAKTPPVSWTELMKKWGHPGSYKPLKKRWQYENLILMGGGSKLVGACGSLIALDQRGLYSCFKRFGGSSAGALTAALLAADYTPQQVGVMLMELPFPAFFDRSRSILQNLKDFFSSYGWFDGKIIADYVQAAMASACGVPTATVVTFEMLYKKTKKELVCTAFRPEQDGGLTCYFSTKTTPKMSVAMAVHASCAFPGVWKPVVIDGFYHGDGGTLMNDPVHIFNSPIPSEDNRILPLNPKTLNIRLYDPSKAEVGTATLFTYDIKIKNAYDFAMSYLVAMMNQLERNSITAGYWSQTIAVSNGGFSAMNVMLTDKEKVSLLDNGRIAAEEFLKTC